MFNDARILKIQLITRQLICLCKSPKYSTSCGDATFGDLNFRVNGRSVGATGRLKACGVPYISHLPYTNEPSFLGTNGGVAST